MKRLCIVLTMLALWLPAHAQTRAPRRAARQAAAQTAALAPEGRSLPDRKSVV